MNILFLKIGVINVKAAALRNVVTCRYKSRQCPNFWGENREFFAAQGMWLCTRFSHYTKFHFFIQIFETNCNIPVFLLSHTHCVFQRPLRQFIWLYCENTCSGIESKEGCKQRCFWKCLMTLTLLRCPNSWLFNTMHTIFHSLRKRKGSSAICPKRLLQLLVCYSKTSCLSLQFSLYYQWCDNGADFVWPWPVFWASR